MTRFTLNQIITRLQRECDLETEDFIGDEELIDVINDAIDTCEANIHTLGREQEYFLADAYISLVNGQAEYSLPTNIYANKIKQILYRNGEEIYRVMKYRDLNRFLSLEVDKAQESALEQFKYILLHNSATDGYKIRLTPTPRASLTNGLHIWYIRNANRLALPADICDIPEFVQYIYAAAKVYIYGKDGTDPRVQTAIADRDAQLKLLQETLGEMIPDGDDHLVSDYSHYEEST